MQATQQAYCTFVITKINNTPLLINQTTPFKCDYFTPLLQSIHTSLYKTTYAFKHSK